MQSQNSQRMQDPKQPIRSRQWKSSPLALLCEIQTKMAALLQRCRSDFPHRIEIYLTRLKEFLLYLGIGNYKVADTRFGFLCIWILTNVRVSVWCACMEILHRVLPCWKAASLKQWGRGGRIDPMCCSATNKGNGHIYFCSKPIRSLHSLNKL